MKSGVRNGPVFLYGIVFRDFRRTVKSNMLEAGVDETYRDELLGHAKEGMDKHYIVIGGPILKKAMQEYTAWLDDKLQSVDLNVDLKKIILIYCWVAGP